MVMNKTQVLGQRIAAFLRKTGATFCDSFLIERLMIASRASFRAALESEGFTVRVGICPDCKTRKQVITPRSHIAQGHGTQGHGAQGHDAKNIAA